MQFDSPARSMLTRAIREHLARLIDAQRVGDPRPEQLEHASGAGADVEQVTRRERADDIGEHRLDFGLIDVERADAMPVRGIVAEIRGGQFGALAFDRREALQIERDRLVLLAACVHQIAAQQADGPARAQPVKDPAPLAGTVEKPGVAEELQMARNARLALSKNLRQFGNGQLAAGAQHEKAQP